MPASALVEASNFLSARMVGRTIEEAQGQLSAEVERHRSDLDELTRRLVEAGMATSTGDGSRPALIVSGPERLLADIPAPRAPEIGKPPGRDRGWPYGLSSV